MKETLKIALCVLTCITWCGLGFAANQTTSPEPKKPDVTVLQEFAAIEVPEPGFDFGEILEGAEVNHDFTVKNTGTSPLRIENIVTNCECIKTEYDSEVQPGKEGKISIKIDSRGYEGGFLKFITVAINDPIQPQLRLTLQGKVQPLVSLQPGNLVSFDGVFGRIEEKAIDLKATTVKVFRITRTESDISNKISYELETISEGKHYRLKVKNKAADGVYNGFIKLFTDLPEKPEISIAVKGSIKDIISVLPPRVMIGKVPSEDRIRFAEVQIKTNIDQPFKITKLSYDEELVKVEQKPLPDKAGYTLLLSAKLENIPAQPAGKAAKLERKQTSLTIQTDADPKKTYEVRVEVVHPK